MFMFSKEPSPLAPGDLILVTIQELTRRVDVRRGKNLLPWIAQGEDFWQYFCQLIKTPEDAHGVAQALAAAAGYGVERVEPLMFRVTAFSPKADRKRGKK